MHVLFGSADALVDALVAGIGVAAETIDLGRQDGVHPRIGAADVVPLVGLDHDGIVEARLAALVLGARMGDELGLPVFLYGDVGGDRRPAFFRRGGTAELQRRIDAGELIPDFGPAQLDPRAGGVLVGARPPLIAFNLVLADADLPLAREVAEARTRERGRDAGSQAIGLELASTGDVQVSMNVIDVERHRCTRSWPECGRRRVHGVPESSGGARRPRARTRRDRRRPGRRGRDGPPTRQGCRQRPRSTRPPRAFALDELAADQIVERYL